MMPKPPLPESKMYICTMDVVVFPQWDWPKVVRAASSGFVYMGPEMGPAPPEPRDFRHGIELSKGIQMYIQKLILVSFGQKSISLSEALDWGHKNCLVPASIREVFSIPVSHPNFYEMLGYRYSVTEDGQSLEVDDPLLKGWNASALSMICLHPGSVYTSESCADKIYSIKCIDHGDFSAFSYWACADTVVSSDQFFECSYDCWPDIPEGRLWFAFVASDSQWPSQAQSLVFTLPNQLTRD